MLGYRILDVLIDLLAVTLLLGLALTGMACSYGAAEGLVAPGASRLDAPLFLAAGLMFFVAAVAPAPLFVAGRAGGADDPRRGFEVVLKGVPDGAGA